MEYKRWFSLVSMVLLVWVSVAAAELPCTETYGTGPAVFRLATGSPGELGLLKVLAEPFVAEHNASLCWVKAGSGASLKLLSTKQVDMIMVHAPAGEKKAVAEGWAVKRTLLGSNEFYLVGPAADPAGIAGAKSAADAYARIAKAGTLFFSRGDNSGTHKKEQAVWKQAGIDPSGAWYVVTKDFMTATLRRANDERGYFMTDSSTWVAEKDNNPNLKILFRGDKFLVNTYHALSAPEGATTQAGLGAAFIEFAASEAGQMFFREYGKDTAGAGLYNDAAYARQYDD
ncbi:MAG: substrate-binding domain-containing protein [Deferrisomatales bacterium]|nr:substrate-binding domain-containing protein [Deferrisomatales bacterium]